MRSTPWPGSRFVSRASQDARSLARRAEPDVEHVAVLDDVALAFQALEAAARCLGVRTALDQVVPADHLGPDEAVGDVSVNRSRRVERRQAVAKRPRTRLLVAGGEKADEVERGEEAADYILERRGALAEG